VAPKRFADKLLAIREVAAGSYEMLKPSPQLGEWAEKYLEGVAQLLRLGRQVYNARYLRTQKGNSS
jgi:hypothetical protein